MSSAGANFLTSIDTMNQIRVIEEACAWASISKGRATRYAALLRELFQENKRSPEHLLAWHESSDVTEMYELWRTKTDLFPGLNDRICTALRDGPVLSVEENSSSTNKARNNAFNYLLAGRLLAAGLDLLAVDECKRASETALWRGDITLNYQGTVFDIQCKRPYGRNSVIENIKKALKQITTTANPAQGIIAIDLSRCIYPTGTLLAASSGQEASDRVHNMVLEVLSPEVHRLLGKQQHVMGLVAFASIPVGVAHLSSVLRSDGMPYKNQYLHSVGQLRILINERSPFSEISKSLYEHLDAWYRGYMSPIS